MEEKVCKLVEGALTRVIVEAELEPTLATAVQYMLFPCGKMIRPQLAFAIGEDLKVKDNTLAYLAAALELIHVSSLIHDDLPAMDNDDFRRGRESCHKAFGESTAILAGDVMIALSNICCLKHTELLTSPVSISNLLSVTYVRLCHGQQLDLNGESDFERVNKLKTGALFVAALQAPAMASNNLDPGELDRLKTAGELLGLHYQLVDDLIDLYGSNHQRGRLGSSDKRNKKETWVMSVSATKVHELLIKLEASLLPIVSKYPKTSQIIRSILDRKTGLGAFP